MKRLVCPKTFHLNVKEKHPTGDRKPGNASQSHHFFVLGLTIYSLRPKIWCLCVSIPSFGLYLRSKWGKLSHKVSSYPFSPFWSPISLKFGELRYSPPLSLTAHVRLLVNRPANRSGVSTVATACRVLGLTLYRDEFSNILCRCRLLSGTVI